ncbi:hypothetical protein CDAR_174461 [Caerostris darwini]|uniref:Uncharacterized protein n=1 Tax=Caerostris darwini TaxID=1538125 RepID=A0AAV4PFU7_9ARAC|nr:hypothetical protein CDAR_174461 [Caerostris darwini]
MSVFYPLFAFCILSTTEGADSESSYTTTEGADTESIFTTTDDTGTTDETPLAEVRPGSSFDSTTTESTYDTSDVTSKSAPTESRAESEEEDADWNQQDFLLPEDILKLDARRIRAEDFQWALSPVPDLSTIIIRSAKHVTGK